MLAWPLYLSFVAAIACFASARCCPAVSRWVALLGSAGGALLGIVGTPGSLPTTGPLTLTRLEWIPMVGAEYHLAVDGISVVLVWLTGLAATASVLFSWNIRERAGEFFGWYLTLVGAVYGVFLSWDLLLLFVFYEIAIVPKYFLIAIWGSTRREYGAMKLALYSFAGSALVLGGLLAAYVAAGGTSFDLSTLAARPVAGGLQKTLFGLVFIGFAVLAGLWPFHTWAPTGHVAAPTAASMLLAGVIMKLGAYGCLRVALTLFPEGWAAWATPLGALAGIGIVWGALVALQQRDFKFVIGYSSVSHMGFVLLGLAAASPLALSGAVLQMFSHGVIAGLLFGVVGRMVYDRCHTRDLDALNTWNLARLLPFAAVTFTLASLASMGLPGFSGFIAELQVLSGAWVRFPLWVLVAGAGLIGGVAYTLRALQKVFYSGSASTGSATASSAPANPHPLEPISLPERLGAVLLLGTTLLVGLYPRLLLDWILPAFDTPLFAELRRRAGW